MAKKISEREKAAREFIEMAQIEAKFILGSRAPWIGVRSDALPWGVKASWKRLVQACRRDPRRRKPKPATKEKP